MDTSIQRPAGLRLVAVVALFTFGCVTVRAPASTIGEEVTLRGGLAEPQVELWIEGNAQVPPQEVAAAAAEARAALEGALAVEGGGQVDPGADWILVARARGVALTPARRHEQSAAKVGLVVGAVVLVALIVVAVVAGGKGGGGKGGGSHGIGAVGRGARPAGPGHLSGGGAARLPPFTGPARAGAGQAALHARLAVRPPPPVVRPPAPVVPGHRPPVPVPRPHGPTPRHGQVTWGVEADLELGWWGPVEGPPQPLLVEEDQLAWRELPGEAAAAPASDGADGLEEPLLLPPPPPWPVESRGYFDGDVLEVELTLVERGTGQAAWRKVARGEVDPRDREGVRALVQPLLGPDGWLPVAEP